MVTAMGRNLAKMELAKYHPRRLEYYLSQTKMVGSSVIYEATNVKEAVVKQTYLSLFIIDETRYSSL